MRAIGNRSCIRRYTFARTLLQGSTRPGNAQRAGSHALWGDRRYAAQGLQKRSVTHMDEALVYLGLAQVQLKSYSEAENTFSSIPATSIVSPRIARLWRLYAATFFAG